MTEAAGVARSEYNGNGATTTFAIGFGYDTTSDIKVIYTDSSGTDTTWTLGTQYSISSTNVVVYTSPTDYTPASGTKLTIISNVSIAQSTDLDNTAYDGPTIEAALDTLSVQIKQIEEEAARAPKLKESTRTTTPTFPEPSASKLIAWNSAADGLENVAAYGGSVTIPATASTYLHNDATGTLETKTATQVGDDISAQRTFATRTALKAKVSPTNGEAAFLGESGREGTFVFDSSDLSTEVTADTLEGIYLPPDSDVTGASGAWVRHNPIGWFNPRWFGAAGDGSTDDSTEITAAIAQIPTSGRGVVIFPAGYNFKITTAISVPTDKKVHFKGFGKDASLVTVSGAINGFYQNNTGGSGLTSGVEFSDFRIDGTSSPTYGIYCAGGGTPAGTDARVQLITITDMYIGGFTNGIRLDKATNVLVDHVFLFGNGYGIYGSNISDSNFTNLKSGSNTSYGLYFVGGAGSAWDEGITVSSCKMNGDAVGVVGKDMFYLWLIGNQFGSTTSGCVQIDNTDNAFIIGNEISNTGGNADGITFTNAPARAIIQGNLINGCLNYGAVIVGEDHLITGNTMTGNGANSGRDLELNNCTGCIASNNRLLSTPTASYSLEEAGTSDYNSIYGNILAKTLSTTGVNTTTNGANIASYP